MELRGGEGPEVGFCQATPTDALAVADEQVELLLAEGVRPKDPARAYRERKA